MSNCGKFLVGLIAAIALCVSLPVHVYADTDGTEIKISGQPEHLTLQLGRQWAGMEFQLETEDGLFSVPVVVNQSGILQMDLCGSKTYILSCIASPIAIPEPEQAADTPVPSVTSAPPVDNSGEVKVGKVKTCASPAFLILFVILFLTAVTGITELCFYLRRKKAAGHEDESED